MSKRYIVKAPRHGRMVPYCNLPGSPFGSRIQAKDAARHAEIEGPVIVSVRRQLCEN